MKKMAIIGLLFSFSGISYTADAQDNWELLVEEDLEQLSDWGLVQDNGLLSCLKHSKSGVVSEKKVHFFKQDEPQSLQVPCQPGTAKKRKKKSTQEGTRQEKLSVISDVQEPGAGDYHPDQYYKEQLPVKSSSEEEAEKKRKKFLTFLFAGKVKKPALYEGLNEDFSDDIYNISNKAGIYYYTATPEKLMPVVVQYLQKHMYEENLGLE